ncbi:MAG TPA: hypothetical protein VFC78_05470 [Tepidisphaeraceae bacterium]|nr:hypothetical protein [Tepidisphaeraceae bacterium]
MKTKSLDRTIAKRKIVQTSAASLRRAAEADLARLERAMSGPIDTSDIAEGNGELTRIRRDTAGRLPVIPKSIIRDAILAALGRTGHTRYQLWKAARKHCATLPESAVYEFLRGKRELGVRYLEALMEAAGLAVEPTGAATHKIPQ